MHVCLDIDACTHTYKVMQFACVGERGHKKEEHKKSILLKQVFPLLQGLTNKCWRFQSEALTITIERA
ncbi:hypothetical protein HanRHA438_Chr14g0668951 [Helianthus annuus]|nr:hypothetical protein HanRHA438_Chr14g0668951 [Helianthus annuus]